MDKLASKLDLASTALCLLNLQAVSRLAYNSLLVDILRSFR